MKKYYTCLILILTLLIAIIGGVAYASDVTDARRIGNIAVTNSGTATTAVSTNFTLSSAALVASGDANSTLTDVTVQYEGVDVPFMPGYGSNPWCVFVDSIGAGQTKNYSLYTGGVTGATQYYFPGSTGFAVADNPDLELADNFTIEWYGFLNPAGAQKFLVYKPNAIFVRDSPANTLQVYLTSGGLSLTASVTKAKHKVEVYADTANLTIEIDDVVANSVALGGATVADTADAWAFCYADVMPYMEYVKVYKAGVLQLYITWQYKSNFTDQSGKGHNPTSTTFRTTSSDADVSAALTSFSPTSEARLTSWTIGGSTPILTSTANLSALMYSSGDYSRLPGADVANALLDQSNTPRALWWYPFIFGTIAIFSFMLYTLSCGRTSRITGESTGMGSLLLMAIAIEALLIGFSALGPIEMWPAYLFPIPALAIILSQKQYGWGWGTGLSENFMGFMMLSWFISVLICVVLEGSDLGRSMGGGWDMASMLSNLSQLQGLSIASLVAIGGFIVDFVGALFRILLWDYSFYTGSYEILRWAWMGIFSAPIVWGIGKTFIPIFANFLRIT